MATLTPAPARSRSLHESHQRVRSPLTRLRGYIRAYVGMEGALLLVLCLALWFWIGLTLDYGSFKAFGIDWVQDWPWAVRLVLLVAVAGVVLALVSMAVFGRLFREFRDAALALVLERRFPKLLGDRLITAVELADLKQAEAQGYSPAMIRETIHEAAERVEQVPVQQAFDWSRLLLRGVIALGLTLGLYLLAGGLFLTLDSVWHVQTGRTGYSRFEETAGIWFERNILLQNTIWPRRAQLELVNWPNELRVGRDNKIPSLHVRAPEYVIADTNTPEGWRALTWNDLATRPQLLADAAPLPEPPALKARDEAAGPSVDEVALSLRKFDVRIAHGGPAKWMVADAAVAGGWRPLLWEDLTAEKLDGLNPPKPMPAWGTKEASGSLTVDEVEAAIASADRVNAPEQVNDADAVLARLGRLADLRATVDKVGARAALPEMSRTLRKLVVPDIIYLRCTGEKTGLRNELHKTQDNEYTGAFGDLKESVVFQVQAEDYYTPRRYITLVPPPSLIKFDVEESRPAYLFYRPDDKTTLADLRGKKQPFEVRDVLQAGSETSRIDVPAGTDLVLTTQSDKELKEAFLKGAKNLDEVRMVADLPGGGRGVVVVRAARVGEDIRRSLELLPDHKGFKVELPDVRKDMVFDFEFTDTDGVKGKRKVVVKPQDDTAPELTDVRVEVMRKAAVKEKDKDHEETYYWVTRKARIPLGAKVHDDHALGEVRYRYTLITSLKADVNAVFQVPVVALAAPGGGGPFGAAAYLVAQDREAQSYAPPQFARNLRDAKALAMQVPPGGPEKMSKKDKFLADEGTTEFLASPTIKALLGETQTLPFRQLVHDFEVKPDETDRPQDDPLSCDFPLWKLMPEGIEENHPFYRMDLWLEATDTDADEQVGPDGAPRPHLTKSKETFSFLIVPETVLLSKIGEDEVKQYATLNKRFQELQEKAAALETSVGNIEKPDAAVKDLLAPSTRAQQMDEDTLPNGLATAREVYTNYQRMVREEQLNVIRREKIEQNQDKIVAPLHTIIDGDYPAVLEANAKFRKMLDDKTMPDKDRMVASVAAGQEVNRRMAKLMLDLNAVLEVMKGLVGVDSLLLDITHVMEGVERLQRLAKGIKEELENKFFDDTTPKKPT